MNIAVSIVDDDAQLREAVAALINNSPEICCVSCHCSGEDALAEIPKVRPDVTLMDINLPGINGLECVRRLKSRLPSNEVIMLTELQSTGHILEALAAGASGYLLKQNPMDEVIDAIKDVHNGGSPMSAVVARRVVKSFQRSAGSDVEVQKLTAREFEIMDMLAKGYRYKEIASARDITFSTVHTHIRKIYEKLQVRSRTEATVKFIGNKLRTGTHLNQDSVPSRIIAPPMSLQ